MSWRDEIDIVLQEWIAALGGSQGGPRWRRVGAVRPAGEAGVYVADLRASDLTADAVDSLRLAGPDDGSVQAGFPVMDATFGGNPSACAWRSSRLPLSLTCGAPGRSRPS